MNSNSKQNAYDPNNSYNNQNTHKTMNSYYNKILMIQIIVIIIEEKNKNSN